MSNYFRVKNGLVVDETTGSAGNVTIADGDISTDGTMTITSTSDAANALYLRANAGTSETIKIHADQGSGAGSIELTSDAGGIDINAGTGITIDATTMSIDGTDDSNITVTGSAKDLDIAVAGGGTQELRLASAGTGTSALHLNASAGGVDIDANNGISIEAGEDIEIGTALADGQSITIGKSGAAQMVLTPHGTAANEKITITNTAGTANDAVKIAAAAGGLTVDVGGDIRLDADGGDVFVQDGGTTYGSLTNNSSKLDIYSGTTQVLRMGTNSVNANASFMGDLTVGGTDQTGSAANRFQVNSPSGSGETIEARLRTSVESPSVAAGVANVLVLDNGNKESGAAQGMITTIGTAAATDQNTQVWFWGRMDSYNRYSLGYTSGKHWDTSSFAGSATSPEKAAQSVFQVDENGRILVGAANGEAVGTEGPQNMVTVFIDDDDGQDGMIFLRQDETTSSGDLLGAIGFDSADGNMPSLATEASAYIAAYATEAHQAGNKGGALVFGVTHLTDDDDTASQEVMRISSDSATSAFVQIGNVDDSGGELRFMEDTDDNTSSATQYAAFRAQAMAASYTMILPAAKGTAGQVLDIASVSGSEITLAWDDVATGGGGDVSAGSSFNTAGVLMAASGGGAKEIDVPGATLTTNGQGLTVGGATIVQPGSSVGSAALTLTATDVDQIALDINASNTTANVLDITADAATTAHVINVSADGLTGTGGFMKMASTGLTVGDGGTSALMDMVVTNDSVGSQTSYGMIIDYNKSGITASGKTAIVAGLAVDIDDSATNVGTATIYGGIFTSNSANAGGTITNVGVYATAGGGDSNYAGIFEAGNVGIGTSTPDHTLEIASSSANEPVLAITNTHGGTSSGELRFNKNSASGADNDVMGMISFYGTDDSDNTHERLAYMDAIITDSAHGSEAASLRFYVAENDATLTQGLLIAGQADNDGEVDVTIGAGSASTATVAGHLNVTGDLTVTGTTTTVHVETTTTSSGVIFEGTTGDGHDATLKSVVAGADVTYTLPNVDGHVALFAADPSTTTISATPAELNLLDTAAADTVVNSKAVIYGSGGEIAASALTVDDVEIDGKVITMTGSSSDTVAMTAATNGEFTIETTDAGGTAGHINLQADGNIALHANGGMTFLIDDDAPSDAGTGSIFQFTTEGTVGTDLSNVDAEMEPVVCQYTSGSTVLGRTEYGKVTLAADASADVFTFNGATFGVAEVTLHLTDGVTQQVNKVLICADTTGTDQVAFSNYSVIYSDGSTELGTYNVTIGSDGTVTMEVDADDNDVLTYAVTFLA